MNKLGGKFLNAHFLRGLGTGLIVAALLFIAWPSKEVLTDEQVRERAGQLGMVDAQKQTPAGTSQPDASTPKVSSQDTPAAPSSETTTPEAPVPQEPTNEASEIQKPVSENVPPSPELKAPNPDEKQVVTITVPKGSTSEDIAQTLLDKGLIQDKKSFDDVVKRLRVASKFKVGTFNFHKGMDTTEIILQMTRK